MLSNMPITIWESTDKNITEDPDPQRILLKKIYPFPLVMRYFHITKIWFVNQSVLRVK